MGRYILAVTGASGIILAYKALRELTSRQHFVDLVFSRAASYTAVEELGKDWATAGSFLTRLGPAAELVTCHRINDFGATIASGSYAVDGMLLAPCSMATLGALAMGLSDNLIRRAADVTLKERRPLVVVPRETPLSLIHLENMTKLTQAGASMLLPVPAWYSHPQSLSDVEDSIVGRALDQLRVPNDCYKRWEGITAGGAVEV